MPKTAILGSGESGMGAAALAVKLGHEVWLSDAHAMPKSKIDVLNQIENQL